MQRQTSILLTLKTIPSRNPVPPPQLAADAPGLDVFHPVEEGLRPGLGHDLDRTRAHCGHRCLGQFSGVHVPLIGQHRFDHDTRSIAERLHDDLVLDTDHQAFGVDFRYHLLARFSAIKPAVTGRHQIDLVDLPRQRRCASGKLACARSRLRISIAIGAHLCRFVHQPIERDAVALRHAIVVLVMRAGDLDRARTERRVGIKVGYDRDSPAMRFGADRDFAQFSNDRRVPLIVGVNRHRAIAQHRFGPGGGNRNVIALFIDHDRAIGIALDVAIGQAIGERVFEVPHLALHFACFHLKVGNRGLQLGVPIDQPLVAVNQASSVGVLGVVQIDEHFHHGLGEVRVHRELLAAPVHRTAEPPQLAGDGAAALGFPFPHFRDEILAGVIGALVLAGFELTLDHHLRGNSRVIGADHPQCITPTQSLVADHHVLQRVVERVADVQRTRHVGRRVDDGERHRIRSIRPEQPIAFPVRIPARFDSGGLERLGQILGQILGQGLGGA